MTTWIFEPGHCTAEFIARHMMVTKVRGHFTGIEGRLEFEPDTCRGGSTEAQIDTTTLSTGNDDRDEHLRSDAFFDVDNHPEMTFRADEAETLGADQLLVTGDLTIRGNTREVDMQVDYQGCWSTPYWDEGVNKGPIRRVGFEARTQVNRHDFEVSWNDTLDAGGVVVGDMATIVIDIEALESGVVEGI